MESLEKKKQQKLGNKKFNWTKSSIKKYSLKPLQQTGPSAGK
jgi:hypothetical protein